MTSMFGAKTPNLGRKNPLTLSNKTKNHRIHGNKLNKFRVILVKIPTKLFLGIYKISLIFT